MTDNPQDTLPKLPMLIYIGDPMCSWCYGFAPVYKEITETFAQKTNSIMIMGGLRPGTTEVMDDRTKKFIAHHWVEVEKRTGQKFDHALFDRNDFVYDTEVPARAVVTLRQTHPELEWEFYERIQAAFYAQSEDTNDVNTYEKILKDMGVQRSGFATNFASQSMRQATSSDFMLSRKMGVNGYPTVLLQGNGQLSVLTMGYQPVENLMPAVQSWLDTLGDP